MSYHQFHNVRSLHRDSVLILYCEDISCTMMYNTVPFSWQEYDSPQFTVIISFGTRLLITLIPVLWDFILLHEPAVLIVILCTLQLGKDLNNSFQECIKKFALSFAQ